MLRGSNECGIVTVPPVFPTVAVGAWAQAVRGAGGKAVHGPRGGVGRGAWECFCPEGKGLLAVRICCAHKQSGSGWAWMDDRHSNTGHVRYTYMHTCKEYAHTHMHAVPARPAASAHAGWIRQCHKLSHPSYTPFASNNAYWKCRKWLVHTLYLLCPRTSHADHNRAALTSRWRPGAAAVAACGRLWQRHGHDMPESTLHGGGE